MLLDVYEAAGADAMAQCDVGERRNHHQPLDALRPMAETVLAVVCERQGLDTAGPEIVTPAPVRRPMSLRCVYTDLDGTLLGAGASLFRDGEGEFTLLPARALEACHRAGVEVVLKSGRRKAQVMEDARLIGQSSYIYEVGSGLVIDGEEQLLCGEFAPARRADPARADRRHRRARRCWSASWSIEPHAPWHVDRFVSHLYRGSADVERANELLAAEGHGGAAADRQRRRRRGRAHLPPDPGGGLQGGGGRAAHARPRLRARRVHRGRGLRGGPRRGRGGGPLLPGGQRARRHRARTSRAPSRATATASTRPWFRRWWDNRPMDTGSAGPQHSEGLRLLEAAQWAAARDAFEADAGRGGDAGRPRRHRPGAVLPGRRRGRDRRARARVRGLRRRRPLRRGRAGGRLGLAPVPALGPRVGRARLAGPRRARGRRTPSARARAGSRSSGRGTPRAWTSGAAHARRAMDDRARRPATATSRCSRSACSA